MQEVLSEGMSGLWQGCVEDRGECGSGWASVDCGTVCADRSTTLDHVDGYTDAIMPRMGV